MAALNYPPDLGYGNWYAWLGYSSEVSPFLESDFTPAGLPIRVRPQGVLLWRGEFQTPVYVMNDPRLWSVRVLMEMVDEGVNQLILPVPADQQRTDVLGATITVQPVEVEAPVRGSRADERGWRVRWVEVPA